MAFSHYAAIIGVDGSGKSTCFGKTLESLAKAYTVVGIGDRVLLANRDLGVREFVEIRLAGLKRLFRNMAKGVSNPLLYKVTKLMELICRVRIEQDVLQNYAPHVMLGDGAPLINTIGWGIRYHPQFFEREQCLKAMYYLSGSRRIPFSETSFYMKNIPEILLVNRLKLASFPVPDTTFFLQVTPEVAVERIAGRGERLQIHETLTFLERLQNAYRLICDIIDSDWGKEVHQISVDSLSVDEVVSIIVKQVEVSMRKNESH